MSKYTITVVDAPEISLTEGEKAGDALLNFYRALGWNGTDYLDPSKIRTTQAVFSHLYDAMLNRYADPVRVGMVMVNIGPSTDNHIPTGKVYLYEGWITPDEPKGEHNAPIRGENTV